MSIEIPHTVGARQSRAKLGTNGLSKQSLLRSYKRTYINYTRNYKSISEVKSRSVVRDEGEGGREVNVNRFLIKLGRTGDGPLFIVTNARTVRIGGLNDRSMFVRYVFELLARINTNIKRKQNSTVTNHHHCSQEREITREGESHDKTR